MIAFANSIPPGYPAVLFAGIDNEGNSQDGVDPDQMDGAADRRLRLFSPRTPVELSLESGPFGG